MTRSEAVKSSHVSEKKFLSIRNPTLIFLYEDATAQAVCLKAIHENLPRNLSD